MSLVMATDIRLPIGWLFSALGLILVAYGLATSGSDIYARSENVNINLWWGLIVLVFGVLHVYPSELAQTFWTAIVAWVSCFVVTIVVSLVTKPRAEPELVGLVYSLTPHEAQVEKRWTHRPLTLGLVVLALTLVLNFVFA